MSELSQELQECIGSVNATDMPQGECDRVCAIIQKSADALEQYRSDLAERDKVARDRLKRIEMLGAVLQRIADSGIENNFAWAWIGGIAKQILQTVPDTDT